MVGQLFNYWMKFNLLKYDWTFFQTKTKHKQVMSGLFFLTNFRLTQIIPLIFYVFRGYRKIPPANIYLYKVSNRNTSKVWNMFRVNKACEGRECCKVSIWAWLTSKLNYIYNRITAEERSSIVFPVFQSQCPPHTHTHTHSHTHTHMHKLLDTMTMVWILLQNPFFKACCDVLLDESYGGLLAWYDLA